MNRVNDNNTSSTSIRTPLECKKTCSFTILALLIEVVINLTFLELLNIQTYKKDYIIKTFNKLKVVNDFNMNLRKYR